MNAKDIFLQAIEIEPPEERQAFVEQACDSDDSLRRRVAALIAAHEDPDSYLERPAAKFDVSATTDGSASGLSDSSSVHGRFLPGTKIAERYRIVSLLGSGGMGEVYRADDLRLGQSVALKFLPNELAKDEKRLAYFHNEVKLARQIAHPNVCRVYDIGEVDGQSFLSMEYIDGEDLKTLLGRIGRLPKDKGVQIAGQLCAGLAAAHAKGVLHRDLKPANIMPDGQGQVRVTDFGLATIDTDGEATAVGMSGTPAYMAPEQLLRGETSIQSDLYSLGLILYELFTGEPTHAAASLAELKELHERGSHPTDPNEIVEDIDPVVEAAIARCLKSDPSERAKSASEVGACLPGGDPLAAIAAAGETPSPELLAAAGAFDGLSHRTSLILLSVSLVGLVVYMCVTQYSLAFNRQGLNRAPELLAEDARDILHRFGDYDGSDYSKHGFSTGVRGGSLEYETTGITETVFWFRTSPEPLIASEFAVAWAMKPRRVGMEIPRWTIPGMSGVQLDEKGRLLVFRRVVPSRDMANSENVAPFDWTNWFDNKATKGTLGFNLDRLESDNEVRLPTGIYYDSVSAWKGSGGVQEPSYVVAASYQGQPTYFEVVRDEPELATAKQDHARSALVGATMSIIFFVMIASTAILARYHYVMRRSDRIGAFRLAVLGFCAGMVSMIMRPNHSADPIVEFQIWMDGIASALFVSFIFWGAYSALEPFCRKRFPHLLISWSRLVRGRFRDPRVGRDIMFGIIMQIYLSIYWRLLAGLAMGGGSYMWPELLLGGTESIAHFGSFAGIMTVHFTYFFLYVFALAISRSKVIAIGVVVFIVTIFTCAVNSMPLLIWPLMGVSLIIPMYGLSRYGLLFLFSAVVTFWLFEYPTTTNLDAFYFQTGLIGPFLVALLACWAAVVASGKKFNLGFLIPRS